MIFRSLCVIQKIRNILKYRDGGNVNEIGVIET
jgi:hypothetical protein